MDSKLVVIMGKIYHSTVLKLTRHDTSGFTSKRQKLHCKEVKALFELVAI